MKTTRVQRDGFSLMEVILALAILTGSLAVLGELARLGLQNARIARDTAQAQLLCESKLAEVTAGLLPAMSVSDTEFEEVVGDGSIVWLYSIDVQPTEVAGMSAVEVTVVQEMDENKRPVHFSLVRWMPDPVDETLMETEMEGMGIE
ncbi:MAG: prepilin-type N-terminal cleavage/methylation domain-containing protein [Thermoguttaceae bacterium]